MSMRESRGTLPLSKIFKMLFSVLSDLLGP